MLGDDPRVHDAGMHGRHDLDRSGLGGQRRRQHPGIEVRAEEPLGNERDFEAELFRPLQNVDRIEIVLVDAAAVARQGVESRLHQRIGPNGQRGRTPDAESHGPLLILASLAGRHPNSFLLAESGGSTINQRLGRFVHPCQKSIDLTLRQRADVEI